MAKGPQNDGKMEAKIDEFRSLFLKYEKYKIKLPLRREHDLTGSRYLNIHENSIKKTHKIYA